MEEVEKELKEADELYSQNKFFEASFVYKAVLKSIQGKKVDDKTKNHIKNRLKESILGSKSEYKELTSITTFNEEKVEQINTINNEILTRTKNELANFLQLVFSTTFICSSSQNKEVSKKSIPLAYQIANFSEHSKQGYLSANNDDYTPLELWAFQMYGIEQNMKVKFHINPILKRLTDNKVLSSDSLLQIIKEKSLDSKTDLSLLIFGIEKYTQGDYISSLHILVPQFENLLLLIAENAGIQTTVIERGKTITKKITLSDLTLQSEEMTKVFTEDYCHYLRFVLYSPLGLSIRHKIAHGVITKEECNVSDCNLVIIALLILLNKVQKR